jgi:hypothetical protein
LWLLFSPPSLYRATHSGETQIPSSSPDHSRINFGDEKGLEGEAGVRDISAMGEYRKDMIPSDLIR